MKTNSQQAHRRGGVWSMAVALAALALGGCVDEVDRAAKQRIFSPEEPPKAVRAAAEPVDAAALGDDAALANKVLSMGAAEAFERIGPHRYKGSASFEWSFQGRKVKLAETRLVEQAGSSDFYVKTDSDRDQGFEVIHVSGRTFARSKYHKFRERKRDRGESERLREDVYGELRTVSSILGGRLALVNQGPEQWKGRSAHRYRFGLAEAPLVVDNSLAHAPPVRFPAGGPDPDTKLRLDFANLRKPVSAQGTLLVDVATGVPLTAELTAVVTAPGDDQQPAKLTLKLSHALEAIGEALAVTAPAEFLPDEDRPDGVAAALQRFEIPRGDAGVAAPKPAQDAESEE